MKRTNAFLVVFGVSLVVLFVWTHSQGEERVTASPTLGKIAVCNVTVVLNQYVKAKELAAVLAEKQRAVQVEDDKRAKAIQKLEATVEALKPGSMEHEKQMLELIRTRADRQTWAQIENLRLQRDYMRKTAEMWAELTAAVSEVANANGIEIVLQEQAQDLTLEGVADPARAISQRHVLYTYRGANITDEVLKKLNQKYHAGTCK